jgi:hypothetical protein
MRDKSPGESHREVMGLRKQKSKLKKLPSIPRRKLDQHELLESLREVRGEIARLESVRRPLTDVLRLVANVHSGSWSPGEFMMHHVFFEERYVHSSEVSY